MTTTTAYTPKEIGVFMRQARARALAASAETEADLLRGIRDAKRRVRMFGLDMAEVDYLERELRVLRAVRVDPNENEAAGPIFSGQARRGVDTEAYFVPVDPASLVECDSCQ